MTKPKTARPSFSLRLQPYEGSLLAEVVQFLNSLDRAEANRRVENVLVMALLAQARLYDESRSTEERRRCCIEACDALDKHASALRQLVGVEAVPSHWAVAEATVRAERGRDRDRDRDRQIDSAGLRPANSAVALEKEGEEEEDDDETTQPTPTSKLNALAAPDEVDALFGG